MGEARPAGAGPTDADDEGVSLVSFRARVADTTARWALIASVIIVGGRIAEYWVQLDRHGLLVQQQHRLIPRPRPTSTPGGTP